MEGKGRKNPIKARKMKQSCREVCRFKCCNKISEEERLAAFKEYYQLADKTRQWQCLNNWIVMKVQKEVSQENLNEKVEIAQIFGKTLKNKSFYDFTLPTSNGPVKVCRTMFLNTLGKFFLLNLFTFY